MKYKAPFNLLMTIGITSIVYGYLYSKIGPLSGHMVDTGLAKGSVVVSDSDEGLKSVSNIESRRSPDSGFANGHDSESGSGPDGGSRSGPDGQPDRWRGGRPDGWPDSRPDGGLNTKPNSIHKGGHEAPATNSNRIKTIAFGSGYWKSYLVWQTIFNRLLKDKCPVSSCSLTFNGNDVDTADALVFNAADLKPRFKMPKNKNEGQIWVLFTAEAPPLLDLVTSRHWRKHSGFDWTMSYRWDSDVIMPYGKTIPIDSTDQPPTRNCWLKKQSQLKKRLSMITPENERTNVNKTTLSFGQDEPALVSWMVSKCKRSSGRDAFVKEMQKYIAVDVYGKCGTKKCGSSTTLVNKTNLKKADTCSEIIEGYYFYLSFENALCKDYVTEKFFKALEMNVVPVVLGLANYSAIAPPNSFINALDFESPKALTDYLKKVAASEKLYNSFFEWKSKWRVDIGHPFSTMVCGLCAKLQQQDSIGGTNELPPTPASLSSHRSQDGVHVPVSNPSEQPQTVARRRDTSDRYRYIRGDHCFTWTPSGLKPKR